MDVVEPTPSPARRRGRAAALVAAGLVAGVVVAGLSVASAQTTPTPTPTAPPKAGAPGHPGRHGLRGLRGPGGREGLHGALHGEFTARKPGGGYQTLAMQVGQVTAVSATSVTVKSEDGFSRTYAVGDGTLVNAGDSGIADVKNGDQVRVLATVAGDTATAVELRDVSRVRELRGRWAPRPPAPSGAPGGPGEPGPGEESSI